MIGKFYHIVTLDEHLFSLTFSTVIVRSSKADASKGMLGHRCRCSHNSYGNYDNPANKLGPNVFLTTATK